MNIITFQSCPCPPDRTAGKRRRERHRLRRPPIRSRTASAPLRPRSAITPRRTRRTNGGGGRCACCRTDPGGRAGPSGTLQRPGSARTQGPYRPARLRARRRHRTPSRQDDRAHRHHGCLTPWTDWPGAPQVIVLSGCLATFADALLCPDHHRPRGPPPEPAHPSEGGGLPSRKVGLITQTVPVGARLIAAVDLNASEVLQRSQDGRPGPAQPGAPDPAHGVPGP